MKHLLNTSHNGKSITVAIGDTLTLSLPYEPVRTSWSFEDNFGFHPALDMTGAETKGGVHTWEFTARQDGCVEISLTQSNVLAVQGPSSITATFWLIVTVQ
jgi:predicted secreted protein